MKPVEINIDTVSLALSRAEFHGLRDALSEAVDHLEERINKRQELGPRSEGADAEKIYDILYETPFTEDTAEEFARALKHDEALLLEFRTLRFALKKITDEGELWRLL
jgi:hypothetical protein